MSAYPDDDWAHVEPDRDSKSSDDEEDLDVLIARLEALQKSEGSSAAPGARVQARPDLRSS